MTKNASVVLRDMKEKRGRQKGLPRGKEKPLELIILSKP